MQDEHTRDRPAPFDRRRPWVLRELCQHPNYDWRVIINTNGVKQIRRLCVVCGDGPTINYKHETFPDVDSIPVIADHRDGTPCERCGSLEGTEYHHWAPSALFDDADNWPTSYLCRDCHNRWHHIVTPGMRRPQTRRLPWPDEILEEAS